MDRPPHVHLLVRFDPPCARQRRSSCLCSPPDDPRTTFHVRTPRRGKHPRRAVFEREPAEVLVGLGLAATRAAAGVSRLVGNWTYDARRGPSGLGEEIGSACR
jgi:hypothetical protein